MSPRPVLFVHSSSGRYGADRQLALLAGGLDRERFTPLVVLPDADGPLNADLARLGVEVIVRPLAVIRRDGLHPGGVAALTARLAADAAQLGALIRRRRVALVHSNTSVVLSGAAAAAATGVPHVWHVREIYSAWSRLWSAHRRLLASAAVLPCVSVAASLQFGGTEAVQVIPDGLAISVTRAQRGAARERLALPHDRPVVAVVGRISDWKGQDQLVRALAEPALAERGVIGYLAGDVWPGAEHRRTAVEDLARRLGVADRVVFGGFVDRIGDVYGAADIIAVPSTRPDPLPGAAIEAAAAGCTVVAAAHGGLPEILQDGRTGRLVAPNDPGALAAALEELVDAPRLRAILGTAASQDVRRRFGPRRLLAAVDGLYRDLTRG